MENYERLFNDLKSKGMIREDINPIHIRNYIKKEDERYIIKDFRNSPRINDALDLPNIICELEVEFQNCDFYSLNITGVIGEKISFIGCKFKEESHLKILNLKNMFRLRNRNLIRLLIFQIAYLKRR